MCMYFDEDSQPVEVYIADEDIICYKILDYYSGVLSSPYRGTKWSVGETKKSDINVLKDEIVKFSYRDWGRRMKTFHESKDIVENNYKKQIIKIPKLEIVASTSLRKITNGLYSFANYMNGEMADYVDIHKKARETFVTARCAIPKGSRYHVNTQGTVFVSDALKLEGIVERFFPMFYVS